VRVYNLNRPAVVAGLIRIARARGWAPLGRRPLSLDGFALLREHAAELQHEPLRDPWLELATQLLERRAAAAGQPPLAWLRAHTPQPWAAITAQQPPQQVALTLACVLELGVWIEQPSALAPPQLAELCVWADDRQHRAYPGGLALATWLASGSICDPPVLADLQRWCEALLDP
jgi:hypothetical protein